MNIQKLQELVMGHTAGPWKVDWLDTKIIKGCELFIVSDNEEVCKNFTLRPHSLEEMVEAYTEKTDADYDPYITSISCGPLYTNNGKYISEANAYLIAAAPDLFAFYLRVKEIMDMDEVSDMVKVEHILQEMNE